MKSTKFEKYLEVVGFEPVAVVVVSMANRYRWAIVMTVLEIHNKTGSNQ